MRPAAIVLTAIVLSSTASAQTPVPFPDLSPEKQQAQCGDIEKRNAGRMQQGLPAVYPWEELCYSATSFGFIHKPDPRRLDQVVTLLRNVVRLAGRQISVDSETSTITLHAAPGKIEMAAWLIRELDRPAFTPGQEVAGAFVHELPVPRTEQDQPGKNDEVMRVYRLAHTATAEENQEILPYVRALGDVPMVFPDNAQLALVVRAPAMQADAAAYIIKTLDVEPGLRSSAIDFLNRAPPRPFLHSPLPANTPAPDVVRVFYPARATSPKSMQQIVTAIRTLTGVQRVFWNSVPIALVVRGTASEIAAAEWLIQSLDVPADSEATRPARNREFHIPAATGNSVLRVLYLGKDVEPDGLQSLLKRVRLEQPGMLSASTDDAAALVFRGSDEQTAQAERSVRDALAVVN